MKTVPPVVYGNYQQPLRSLTGEKVDKWHRIGDGKNLVRWEFSEAETFYIQYLLFSWQGSLENKKVNINITTRTGGKYRSAVFRIRMFLGHLDQDLEFVCTTPDPDPSINKQKIRKTLISPILWLLLWLFIFELEEWCKCTFEKYGNEHKTWRKKTMVFYCRLELEGHWRKIRIR